MRFNVYAVYDEAAKIFKYDFKRLQHAEAIRYFGDGVRAEKTELNQHPQDFSLFFLGEYDDETGKHTDLVIPERISRGTDFLMPMPEVNHAGS